MNFDRISSKIPKISPNQALFAQTSEFSEIEGSKGPDNEKTILRRCNDVVKTIQISILCFRARQNTLL